MRHNATDCEYGLTDYVCAHISRCDCTRYSCVYVGGTRTNERASQTGKQAGDECASSEYSVCILMYSPGVSAASDRVSGRPSLRLFIQATYLHSPILIYLSIRLSVYT